MIEYEWRQNFGQINVHYQSRIKFMNFSINNGVNLAKTEQSQRIILILYDKKSLKGLLYSDIKYACTLMLYQFSIGRSMELWENLTQIYFSQN